MQSSWTPRCILKVSPENKQLKLRKSVCGHVDGRRLRWAFLAKLSSHKIALPWLYVSDCWLPTLKIIRCTLRAHVIPIKLLPWRAKWLHRGIFPAQKRYGMHFWHTFAPVSTLTLAASCGSLSCQAARRLAVIIHNSSQLPSKPNDVDSRHECVTHI